MTSLKPSRNIPGILYQGWRKDWDYLKPFSTSYSQRNVSIFNYHPSTWPFGLVREWGSIAGRVKNWYLIPPYLTLIIIIRYVSRVKWRNPKKRVAPSNTSQCRSKWKLGLATFFFSSSFCAGSTDLPNPISPPVFIFPWCLQGYILYRHRAVVYRV